MTEVADAIKGLTVVVGFIGVSVTFALLALTWATAGRR